ncbi:flagellar biosynthesis protein FliQ [Govanella unica]|uniref:Flagellar biosynthetic protein FliQ n=1 Tax=Govanella unica TaxID=2975056 RepID=A0A9X3Z6S5_9PROT|nr:flagellar biosynthesis protein FliQ [Govania unica]MDA5193234.1 flagellar biosynthesis protein FliQ [Govania unica]
MTGADVLDVARDGILVFLLVALPSMLVALTVGVAISLIQALTQIQEQTLTFVPKIIAIFLSFILMLPFMGETLGHFMERIADRIATGS